MPSLRVLVAPNAFKGCLSALDAARAMAAGVRRAGHRPVLLPISDGGDGLMDCLRLALGGRRVRVRARGPLGGSRLAEFLLMDGTAVVEMARASGLALLPPGRRDPLGASSYGTGELIRAALDRGARRVLVGLGGSATNDGGAGAAQALGARLLDAAGRELRPGAEALLGLSRLELGGLDPRLKRVELLLVSDVDNPLLGPKGSAAVYGPQKGASPAQVRVLEAALTRWAELLERATGRAVARRPGAGAAGGLGAGLMAVAGARAVPGARWVLRRIGAAAKLRDCQLALTGEGSFDRQSLRGKGPAELARLARSLRVPARLVCGRLEKGLVLRRLGFAGGESLVERYGPDAALRRTRPLLAEAAERQAALELGSRGA